MKVLYAMIYAPEKGGSGAPIYTNHLMNAMQTVGYSTGIVFSTSLDYEPTGKLPYALHPIRLKHPPIFDSQPQTKHSKPFKDMTRDEVNEYIEKFYNAFVQLTNEEKYDLIHVQHGMYIGYAAALHKEKSGMPYCITLHAMELNFLEEFPDPICAMKAMVEANVILALTEAQKKRLLSEYTRERIIQLESKNQGVSLIEAARRYAICIGDKEIHPNNVVVCELGIDTDRFDIRPNMEYTDGVSHLPLTGNTKLVMYAARLIDMKGIKHLLDAERYYNKDGNVVTIVIGGGNLEEWVRKETLKRSQVIYLGFKQQEQMPMYLNFLAEHAGIFAVPSSSEGFSLVYLEAMACGARILASCRRDMGDLDCMQPPYVQFAEFGNTHDIGDKIYTMLQETTVDRTAIRKSMIHYNLDTMFEKVYMVYNSMRQINTFPLTTDEQYTTAKPE